MFHAMNSDTKTRSYYRAPSPMLSFGDAGHIFQFPPAHTWSVAALRDWPRIQRRAELSQVDLNMPGRGASYSKTDLGYIYRTE